MSMTIETVRVVAEPYGFKVINRSDLTDNDVLYVEPTEQPKPAAQPEPHAPKKRAK